MNKPISIKLSQLPESRFHNIFEVYKEGRTRAKLSYVNKSKLSNEYPYAYIWYSKTIPKPISGILYKKTKHGMKIGASFTVDPKHYKTFVLPFYATLLKNESGHFYAEVSNALEHLLSKERNMDKVRIHNISTIRKVLNKNNIRMLNKNGWYNRYIKVAGGRHRKRMYGNPKL